MPFVTTEDFDYSNIPNRPAGPFVRLGSVVVPGIRQVQKQIMPYALAWQQQNLSALSRQGPVWVVLGDSMSQGIGASSYDLGWVGQLATQLQAAGRNYRIINLSVSGARIADVLNRQVPAMEVLGVKPALVTLMIGSNDMVRKKYRAEAPTALAELLRHMPDGAVVANLLGGAGARDLDLQLQNVAQVRNFKIADMRRHGPRNWRDKVAEDRFHPNDAGYAAIARVFALALGM